VKQSRRYSGVVLPNIDPEEIETHIPSSSCFFVSSDDVYTARLSLALSSVLLSLYGRAPRILAELVRSVLGVEPVKYDISSHQVGYVFYLRNALKQICMKCAEVGSCPWGRVVVEVRSR